MATNNSANENQVGIQSNNGTGTFFGVSMAVGSSKLSIVNANGTGGNPTYDVVPANISINALGSTPLTSVNGGTGVASPTAHALPVAEGGSAFNFLGPMTNGQLLIGSTGADPVPAALTAGTGITVTNAAGSITIASTATPLVWNDTTSGTVTMAPANGYLADSATLVTLTLPAAAAQFTMIRIAGNGAGGWKVAQNSGQNINFGSLSTTMGVTGSLASTNRYDCVELLCVVANTTWNILDSIGNVVVV
jgi:hypothetical protein